MTAQILATLLPVFLISGAGTLYGKLRSPDIRSLNTLNMELFVPMLVFAVLADRQAPLEDYAAEIRLATDDAERLTGRVAVTAPEGGDTRFSATLDGDLTPLSDRGSSQWRPVAQRADPGLRQRRAHHGADHPANGACLDQPAAATGVDRS